MIKIIIFVLINVVISVVAAVVTPDTRELIKIAYTTTFFAMLLSLLAVGLRRSWKEISVKEVK
jgi:hypothetical protein